MNNIQIRAFVRQLITENKVAKPKKMKPKKMDKTSVGNRLKMIDEAGDKASLQAKIATIDNDIKEANEIKAAIPSNISHFVDSEIIGDLHDDLAKSIEELKAKKVELEDQMSEMNAPAKETKKPTEEPKELKEEVSVTKEQISQKYNEMMGKNPSTTFADVAKALGVTENQIAIALGMGSIGGLKLEGKKPSAGMTKKAKPTLVKKAKITKK